MSDNLKYDVKIQSIRPEGTMKATATVNINDAFAVRGVKLMEGSNTKNGRHKYMNKHYHKIKKQNKNRMYP